eukprot:scaffold1085_cov407-Prasinococcus_capsulatus_cf.AAC.17
MEQSSIFNSFLPDLSPHESALRSGREWGSGDPVDARASAPALEVATAEALHTITPPPRNGQAASRWCESFRCPAFGRDGTKRRTDPREGLHHFAQSAVDIGLRLARSLQPRPSLSPGDTPGPPPGWHHELGPQEEESMGRRTVLREKDGRDEETPHV